MGTHHTGIPLSGRNIQPPLTPVVMITINKTITGFPSDETQFYLRITLPTGFTLTTIPFSQQVPFVFPNLQYGTYTIAEETTVGYTLTSITPSTFTLSASNPQQIVEIVNSNNSAPTGDYIIEEDGDYITDEIGNKLILEDVLP